ncbi:hypothetical protein [Nocardia sp. IFM 10818]
MKKTVAVGILALGVFTLSACSPAAKDITNVQVKNVPVPGQKPVTCVVVDLQNEDGVAVSCDWEGRGR